MTGKAKVGHRFNSSPVALKYNKFRFLIFAATDMQVIIKYVLLPQFIHLYYLVTSLFYVHFDACHNCNLQNKNKIIVKKSNYKYLNIVNIKLFDINK